jgi:hypothetical protein
VGLGSSRDPEESIRLSFLIDPRPGGRATLRREGGSASLNFLHEKRKNNLSPCHGVLEILCSEI